MKVIHGDNLTIMRDMPSSSIDLVITSPPYNLGEGMESKGGLRVGHGGSKWKSEGLRHGYNSYSDDMPYPQYIAWQQEILKECWRLLTPAGAIYYNHKPRVVDKIMRHPRILVGDLPIRQEIIWDRGSGFNYQSGAYMPMYEVILLIAKPDFKLRDKGASGVGDVWSFPPDNKNADHPAPFPLELPRRILETTTAQRILDPFAGSCTTGIACVIERREFIGIEIDEYYCELGRARMKRAAGESVEIPKRAVSEKVLPLFA